MIAGVNVSPVPGGLACEKSKQRDPALECFVQMRDETTGRTDA